MGLKQTTRYIMDTTKIEIKHVANGLVLELGDHVTGWETVFCASDKEEVKRLIGAFIDVQHDKVKERKSCKPEPELKHTPQLMLEKLN